jgi:hypothetical protein
VLLLNECLFLFRYDSVRKLLDTPSYMFETGWVGNNAIVHTCSTHVRDEKTNIECLSFSFGPRVRFSAGAEDFSVHHHVQNSSGVHPASYPMGTRGSFSGGEATGA